MMAMEWLSNSFSLQEEEISPARRRRTVRNARPKRTLPTLGEESGGGESRRPSIPPADQVREWREADLVELNQRDDENGGGVHEDMLAVQNAEMRSELSRTREELERVKWEKEQMSRDQDEKENAKDEVIRLKQQLERLVEEGRQRESGLDELTSAVNDTTIELEEVKEEKFKKEKELAELERDSELVKEELRNVEKENALLEEELRALLAVRGVDAADMATGKEEKPTDNQNGVGDHDGQAQDAIEASLERVTLIQRYAAKSISRLYALVKQLRKEEVREVQGSSRKIEDLKRVLSLTEKAVLVQEELEISLQLIETRLTRRFEQLRGAGDMKNAGEKEIDLSAAGNSSALGKIVEIEEEAMKALEETKQDISKEIKALKNSIREVKAEVRRKPDNFDSLREAEGGTGIVATEDMMRQLQLDVCSVVTNSNDKDEAVEKIGSLFATCKSHSGAADLSPVGSSRSLVGSVVKYDKKKEKSLHKERSRKKLFYFAPSKKNAPGPE